MEAWMQTGEGVVKFFILPGGAEVRQLAAEVPKLDLERQITVLNGNSGGNVTSLAVLAGAVGAVVVLSYGYMRWKGLSISGLMYVTKSNMATAVSNLTKHLEHVSEVLAATKRDLTLRIENLDGKLDGLVEMSELFKNEATQRIENLDGKLDEQVEMLKLIKNEVTDVRVDLSQIVYDVDAIRRMVSGVDEKIMSLEDKLDLANKGVQYLCDFVNGGKGELPGVVQEQLRLSGKSHGYITGAETMCQNLGDIADALESGNANRSITDGTVEGTDRFDDRPRSRSSWFWASTKC